jgi:hypothetical protein
VFGELTFESLGAIDGITLISASYQARYFVSCSESVSRGSALTVRTNHSRYSFDFLIEAVSVVCHSMSSSGDASSPAHPLNSSESQSLHCAPFSLVACEQYSSTHTQNC